jgi:two-component system sensor histidine kinase ChvG
MAVTGQDLPGLRKPHADTQRRHAALWRLWGGFVAEAGKGITGVSRLLGSTVFGSLTRRIIVLNLVALAVLVTGILYLNQWRAGLIDARVQSLRVQGEIIAAAIAASATVDSDVIQVDPERLLQLNAGGASPLSYFDPNLEFPISPERVAPLLRNLVTPTRTRARIYDQSGFMILDSASIYSRGEVIRSAKPVVPPAPADWWTTVMSWVPGDDFPPYQEFGADEGTKYPEVAAALKGAPADVVRVDQHHQLVISVAVPVQRVRATVGVLLLSTAPGEIDSIVATERWGVLRIALVAATVTIVLSLLLASTIAGPLRRLAQAAEKVQGSITSREEIPDFSYRTDEVGHLSRALRSMTSSLYNRIEAIERFAADVAHELKNPLTSLRSAVETLPLARNENSRARLLAVIEHDVKRLDRLISDISDASRLDAELQRQDMAPVDIRRLLNTLTGVANETKLGHDVGVEVRFEGRGTGDTFSVPGHDSRLGQVISNLLSNAQSFSTPGNKVRIVCRRVRAQIEIVVDDDGPGIRPDALERVFERFYTDRPHQGFGQNSGLGLSISKQIIEAHGGRIWAENRPGPIGEDGEPTVSGARYVVRLPAP